MAITFSAWCRRPSQLAVVALIEQGLKRHGVVRVGDYQRADFAVTWGTRNPMPFKACPHVLVMERAYLGDRFNWISLGWDGLNGKANFCNADVPDDRWLKFWRSQMLPQTPGRGALIIGQVTGDMATQGVDLQRWARKVASGLEHAGVDWAYRPHPESIRKGQRQALAADPRTLEQALAQCDSVITYNSNVGVLAAMAGKRLTCENDGAMAWEVAGHGWQDDCDLGDRDEWGRKLAYCQWLPDEIAGGQWWDTLGRVFG